MTAKKYLGELKRMSMRIEQKEAEKQALYSAGLSGAAPDRERVTGSTEDRMPDLVYRIAEIGAEIDRQISEYLHRKHAIIDQIQGLNNENYIAVLYKRYVEFKRLEEIAREMSYSYDRVRHLHGRALQGFERTYPDAIAAFASGLAKVSTQ